MSTFMNKVNAMRRTGRHIGEIEKTETVKKSTKPVIIKPKKPQKRVKEMAVEENDEKTNPVIEIGVSSDN